MNCLEQISYRRTRFCLSCDAAPECRDLMYLAPSGVQKERIQTKEIFVAEFPTGQDSTTVVVTPSALMSLLFAYAIFRGSFHRNQFYLTGEFQYQPEGLKCTECYSLFMSAYKLRGAGAVIHSHSQNAFMATIMYPGKEFVVTHMEMIKVSSTFSTCRNSEHSSFQGGDGLRFRDVFFLESSRCHLWLIKSSTIKASFGIHLRTRKEMRTRAERIIFHQSYSERIFERSDAVVGSC